MNSRERAKALLTSCATSAFFGSLVSACRLFLVSLAGLLARPSTKRSSRLTTVRRAISGGVSRLRILSSTTGVPPESNAGRRLGAAEGVARLNDCADRRALLLRQPRTPDVADENDARLIAVVPRLVLDRVVEYPGLADSPLARLAADAKPAAGRHDQRQMHDQAKVGDASVRRDPRVRLEHREQRRG